MIDHKSYAIAKFIIITLCMLMSISTVITIINTRQLRNSPIFCLVAYAIATNFIENIVVFYIHDFPSAMVEHDMMEDYHGVIAFVAMTKWFAHMMNLFAMTVYYMIQLYDYEVYLKARSYRFAAMIVDTIIGVLFAAPYVFSDFYGFDFTIESLEWSYANSNHDNHTHFKPSSAIFSGISWFFLGLLTLVVAGAAVVMFIAIYRARQRDKSTMSAKSFHENDKSTMLIAAFFIVTIAYYIPILSFNLTPLWYNEHSESFYETLDIIEDAVENTKWKLYTFSSSRFRAALAWTIFRRKNVRVVEVAKNSKFMTTTF